MSTVKMESKALGVITTPLKKVMKASKQLVLYLPKATEFRLWKTSEVPVMIKMLIKLN